MPEEQAALDPLDMALKRQLNPKADEKNRIELRQGRHALMCGARKKHSEGFCKSYAGAGTDHVGYGRCKYCGGRNTGPRTAAGKAAASQNNRKHGFYSQVLSYEEREAYEDQLDADKLSLQHEIYMLKAKIVNYLGSWRKKYDRYYALKLKEDYVRYECKDPDCKEKVTRGELDGKLGYCLKCGAKSPKIVERWTASRTEEEAQAYAESMTKVYFSEGIGGVRNYFHAGTLEDKTLDRALRTLSTLVDKQAKLTQESGEDLLSAINKELQQASQGKVSISWGGKPQTREGEPGHAEATKKVD